MCDMFTFILSQVTEMRVHMDCQGCEKQVRKALENLEGKATHIWLEKNML